MLIKSMVRMWLIKLIDKRIERLSDKRSALYARLLADDMLPSSYVRTSNATVEPFDTALQPETVQIEQFDIRIISKNLDDESVMFQIDGCVEVLPAKVGPSVKHIPLGYASMDVIGNRFNLKTDDGRLFSC